MKVMEFFKTQKASFGNGQEIQAQNSFVLRPFPEDNPWNLEGRKEG